MKLSAATERALKRISQGESKYAAAKAEGIALGTIYRAAKKHGALFTGYAYRVGALVRAQLMRSPGSISGPLLANVAQRPDKADYYLSHMMALPEGQSTAHGERITAEFWRGYHEYKDRRSGARRLVADRRGLRAGHDDEPEVDATEVDNTPI